ncbi:MAG: ABC transporter substrate-binding protein, partial [Pseudomonadota bacterium]|nr:ABC transporter substrate-binding protein [Pseudomonadota bacterium]
CLQRLKEGRIEKPTAVDELHRRVMAITGDPLPYGIEPNRAMLEEAVAHCITQGIIDKPVAVDELFARGTHGLVA